MKLNRSELVTGFKQKLFEIPVESLNLEDVRFQDKKVICELSAEMISSGFRLKGQLSADLLEDCDRCLVQYVTHHHICFEFCLTSDPELIDESGYNVIFFPDTTDTIDISTNLQDLIYLDEPLKKVCSEDCLGLCSHCGINLNRNTCNCKKESVNNPLGVLKDFIH